MNNSQHNYYKNNINKRDNDIFNRSVKTNMRSIQLETSANTIGYVDTKQRCVTPYKIARKPNENPFLNNYSTTNSLSYNNPNIHRRQSSLYNRTNPNLTSPLKTNVENINNINISHNEAKTLKNMERNNTSYNFNKNENKPTKEESDLVCNNCFNQDLINLRESSQGKIFYSKGYDENELAFSNKMNQLKKDTIDEKTKLRENLANFAGKSIDKYRQTFKEQFRSNMEQQPHFLEKRNDAVLLRAKERNKNHDELINNNIDKFQNPERAAKTKYFRHYVDNLTIEPKNNLVSPCLDPEFKKMYSSELKEVICKRYEAERDKRENEKQAENEKIEKSNNEFYIKNGEKMKYIKNMNDNFIYTNLHLMNNKKQKENSEKEKDLFEGQKAIHQNNEQMGRIKQQEEMKKIITKQIIEDALVDQIQNKQNQIEQEKINSKNAGGGLKFSCDHGNTGICSICQKSYPKKMLNQNLKDTKRISNKTYVAQFLNNLKVSQNSK